MSGLVATLERLAAGGVTLVARERLPQSGEVKPGDLVVVDLELMRTSTERELRALSECQVLIISPKSSVDASWLSLVTGVPSGPEVCFMPGKEEARALVGAAARILALVGFVDPAIIGDAVIARRPEWIGMAPLVRLIAERPWDIRRPRDIAALCGMSRGRLPSICLEAGFGRVEHLITWIRVEVVEALVTRGLSKRVANLLAGIDDSSSARRQLRRARRRAPVAVALAASFVCAASACTARPEQSARDAVAVVVSGPDDTWHSGNAWRLEPELRLPIQEGSRASPLIAISALEVGASADLYVLDRGGPRLSVFDSAVRLLRTLGRGGSGPGEFQSPIGMVWDASGCLAVIDQAGRQYLTYEPDGRFLLSRRRELSDQLATRWRGGVSGGVVVEVAFLRRETHSKLVVLTDSLTPASFHDLPVLPLVAFERQRSDGELVVSVPFGASTVWEFADSQTV
jgi:hypothetical protein